LFAPFLWGKVNDLSASPLLSACCDGLLFVFQFCRAIWLWVLLTGSGDEFFGPLPALFQAVAYHLSTVTSPAFLVMFTKVHTEISFLLLPPFSDALSEFLLPLPCAIFQFFVYCSDFFLCGVVSMPKGLCWFILGVAGGILCDAWCSPFGLLNVSQAGLEPVSGSGGSPPVFSV
jgi:hypothetical protein